MAAEILAQQRELSGEELRRAIKERSTRGLLLHNARAVEGMHGDAWIVAGCDGAHYRVDLAEETCTCPDFTYRAGPAGIACKHIIAVAIGLASRRSGVRVVTLPATVAGDPFAHRGKRRECAHCFAGWLSITVEEDGNERSLPVPCKRCAR